jgi:hypothetical protein
MSEPAEEFDGEHQTRSDETIAVNESMQSMQSTPSTPSTPSTQKVSPSIFRSRSEMLVSAIAIGQIAAVVGAANLRRRKGRVLGIEGPSSMLSRSGAPVRVVAVSPLRRKPR